MSQKLRENEETDKSHQSEASPSQTKEGPSTNINNPLQETGESFYVLQNVPAYASGPETTTNVSSFPKVCNCRHEEILDAIKELKLEMTRMFTELTGTIIQLRKEVRSLKTNLKNDQSNPFEQNLLPFATLKEFLDFEEKISKDPKNFDELQQAFKQKGYGDPVKFIKNSLKFIFTDEVAKEFCWMGKKSKRSARTLRVVTAIKNAFHQNFPQTSEEVFDKFAMRHFQYASDRLNKKSKYRANTA